jgi:hypothetical protein
VQQGTRACALCDEDAPEERARALGRAGGVGVRRRRLHRIVAWCIRTAAHDAAPRRHNAAALRAGGARGAHARRGWRARGTRDGADEHAHGRSSRRRRVLRRDRRRCFRASPLRAAAAPRAGRGRALAAAAALGGRHLRGGAARMRRNEGASDAKLRARACFRFRRSDRKRTIASAFATAASAACTAAAAAATAAAAACQLCASVVGVPAHGARVRKVRKSALNG